ncbi:MAG TPA: O-antigen ligase family protein [Candidatus Dormibacteraeota bacterium]|nr:O-antigen ligase family protein [Candidatus Dormibacteraeota bacterium]
MPRLFRWWGLTTPKGALIGFLPVMLLLASPNRVIPSFVVAAIYVVGAAILARPKAADRPALLYAGVAAAFMVLMLVRMETLDPLDSAQRAYGLAKGVYFLGAILPLAVASVLLISTLDDLRPAAVTFVVMAVAFAVPTLIRFNGDLLGTTRYATLGNLIAVGSAILFQFWIEPKLRLGAGLALLTLLAVVPTESRQSIVAIAVVLVATAIYWLMADRIRVSSGPARSFGLQWKLPTALGALGLAAVGSWAALIQISRHISLGLPIGIANPVECNCIAGRFVLLITNQGGRSKLFESGWALFTGHPIIGGGLGSFAGRVSAEYPYPHNLPLEVAGEMGIVGVVVLLVPLVVGWVRLAMAGIRTGSQGAAAAIMIVLVYAVVANLSGDLPSARDFWVFGLVVLKLGFRNSPPEVQL